MKIEKLILGTLLNKRNWEAYGRLFQTKFFESPALRDLYLILKDYWDDAPKSVTDISTEVFAGFITSRSRDAEHESLLLGTFNKVLEDMPTNSEEVIPLVKDALYKSSVRDTARIILDRLENNNLDLDRTIQDLTRIQRSLITQEKELSPLDDVASIISEDKASRKYTTGLAGLDEKLNGGLWSGEIGLVIAPSGSGKTQSLINFGSSNLRQGGDVYHATTEISRSRTAIRYYQNLLREPRESILLSPKDLGKRLGDLHLGKWQIRDYSQSNPTTGQIRHDLIRFLEDGAVAPLVIVDYADHLRPNRYSYSDENRLVVRSIIEELRQIAVEFDVAVWTASQSNRPSYQMSDISMANVAESLGKIEVSDVVIVFNQDDNEKDLGTGRYKVEKHRERVVHNKTVTLKVLTEYQTYEEI